MYDPTTGILTKTNGLSIDEIRQCLGSSSRDLATLCVNENINKWAKHKPVVLAKITELTDDDFKLANYGISVPSTGYSSLSAMVDAVSSGALQWTYSKPTGGLNVAPFRLLDFDKYYHYARVPIYSIGNSGSYCDGSAVNLGIGFGRILPGSEMEIALDDLRAGGQSVSNTFGEMYFGICVYDDSEHTVHTRCYASTANVKYKEMVSASVSEVGVIVNGVSTPSSGTRRYIAFPFFSTIPFASWTSSFAGTMFPVPDVTAYHDFTYQSRYTYGTALGYYLGSDTYTLNYQFAVHSNQYTTFRVTLNVLDDDDRNVQQLYDANVTIPSGSTTYRSSVMTRSDGLLWDAAKIQMIVYVSGIGTLIDSKTNIIRGADPLDPPTP